LVGKKRRRREISRLRSMVVQRVRKRRPAIGELPDEVGKHGQQRDDEAEPRPRAAEVASQRGEGDPNPEPGDERDDRVLGLQTDTGGGGARRPETTTASLGQPSG